MSFLTGRPGQRSRETYPTPQFAPVIPLALPTQVVFAESTGDTQTAVKRVDGGAVTQIASGQGEFAFWWPVMTGSVSGVVTGGYEGGYVQGNAVTRPGGRAMGIRSGVRRIWRSVFHVGVFLRRRRRSGETRRRERTHEIQGFGAYCASLGR